jgi:hypothetical protein
MGYPWDVRAQSYTIFPTSERREGSGMFLIIPSNSCTLSKGDAPISQLAGTALSQESTMKSLAYVLIWCINWCLLCIAHAGQKSEAFLPGQDPAPMGVGASPRSLERFLKLQGDADFLTFPEDREHAIRLLDGIPEIWTLRTQRDLRRFSATVQPGEYFVFQIGLYAHRKDLDDLHVVWSDLRGNPIIPESQMTCFNTSGRDHRGRPFEQKLRVSKSRVQPLWFGVQVPLNAKGEYHTTVHIGAANSRSQAVEVDLSVSGPPVENRGVDRGKSLSRLAWLNTTVGTDQSITRGYESIRRSERHLQVLGRTVDIDGGGLPSRITSFFEPSNQFLVTEGRQLLHDAFRFVVEKEDGSPVRLVPGRLRFVEQTASAVSWQVQHSSPECDILCTGRMEFDGFMEYTLTLTPRTRVKVRDIRLEIPMKREITRYMMGLNHEGGLRSGRWDWHWDTTKNQDMLWIGDVNAGLRIKWKADNYLKPLINLYYAYGPLRLPPSWGNGGRGGVNIADSGVVTRVQAYSGPRELVPGRHLHFDFELLVTPFRTIDTAVRWDDRYFHGGGTNSLRKIAMADSVGANIINIHHAEDVYPFINYPYLDENVPALRRLVDSAHRANKRLKLYYTTRELTKNLPEFWAFNSLNGEIIFPGPASACTTIINPRGPDEWLKKNLKEHYIPAWLNPILEGPFKGELDLAVITTPGGRLNNFYIGGLDWMLGHLGIDGVYIDDSALDRETVRRARKLIDHYRPRGRIDFHSWNHFNDKAGFTNCLNLYMDLLPYFDLVWIGEMRDYNRLPDHWLIEVSGIPFGLTGQMLNEGGNPWRGMVYGITNRPGWAGDPSQLWRFWDAYNIQTKTMVGYWDEANPVRTGNDLVKATLYRGAGQSIIAVAGWGKNDLICRLEIDWNKLGLEAKHCAVSIPAIRDFQEGLEAVTLDTLRIPAGKGYLIVVEKKPG